MKSYKIILFGKGITKIHGKTLDRSNALKSGFFRDCQRLTRMKEQVFDHYLAIVSPYLRKTFLKGSHGCNALRILLLDRRLLERMT
jgi:hypothetical protein